MGLWGAHLAFALTAGHLTPTSAWTPLHALLQAYLFTGLFITGHDAMHGVVSRRPRLNAALGTLACLLFAGLSYRRLVKNHRLHHAAPASEGDPDFGGGGTAFWPWFGRFMWHYTTVGQLLVMAAAFNLLKLAAPEWRLWAFWVVPALLATLQLFFFGTYLPHRRPVTDGMAPHHARSQEGGHLRALLSCYFFGYHWEHHASPGTPWWRLWQVWEARRGPGARV
jgi:beta-carotene ketolase (CrtW type)